SQQYIECPLYYVVKSFRNGRCGRNFKSFPFQDCRQGEPDIGLIVNKQEPVKLHARPPCLHFGCKVAGGCCRTGADISVSQHHWLLSVFQSLYRNSFRTKAEITLTNAV